MDGCCDRYSPEIKSENRMREISIDRYTLGEGHPPFIIAEISANHNGSLEQALKLVDKAKAAGVHAIKLQTYTPDTLTLDVKEREFLITNENSPWKGRTLYDLYKDAYTPWEWHDAIFKRCLEWGLVGFSSPFDESAVDFLESFEVPCYKIASPEIVDLPLIKYVASKKKPMFISTGGASEEEINEAIYAAKAGGCDQIILMKCTMSYPAKPKDMNLRTIQDMIKKFNVPVGLSDHSLGVGVAIASISLGACAIEKHFTELRNTNGVDSAFSTEPDEFKCLVEGAFNAWEALGSVHYGPLESEMSSYAHRPSIYFVKDLVPGTVIRNEDIRTVRPSNGLPPKEIDRIIGAKVKVHVKRGTPVSFSLLE